MDVPLLSSDHTRVWLPFLLLTLWSCTQESEPVPQRPASPPPASTTVFTNFETGANVKALALDGPYLWMGLPNGLIRYDTRTLDSHEIITAESTSSGLLSNGIYMIHIDQRGDKWIGTYGGGLMRYNGQSWTAYTPFGFGSPLTYGDQWQLLAGGGVGDLWVYDLAVDHNGVYWIATWKGVTRYDGHSFQTFTEEDGLADKWVYAVAIDRHNILWFGTEGGLTRYDPAKEDWQRWTHDDGLGLDVGEPQTVEEDDDSYGHHGTGLKSAMGPNPNYILDIALDPNGVKWIGTWGGGLSRFDESAPQGQQWTSYSTRDGLGGHYIHVLKFDEGGTLWIGSEGGVTTLSNGRWTTYTTADGLLDNNVFSIEFGPHGVVWVGTWRGLSKMEHPRVASR